MTAGYFASLLLGGIVVGVVSAYVGRRASQRGLVDYEGRAYGRPEATTEDAQAVVDAAGVWAAEQLRPAVFEVPLAFDEATEIVRLFEVASSRLPLDVTSIRARKRMVLYAYLLQRRLDAPRRADDV